VAADLTNGVFGGTIGHKVRIEKVSGEVIEKLVGEAARRSMSALSTLSREKPAEIRDVLVLTAAYLCGAGTTNRSDPAQVDLAVGLPLAWYKSQKNALKQRLESLSATVSVDDSQPRYISIGRVTVFPQGAGVVLFDGSRFPKTGWVGIIDVGGYTTDFMLMEMVNGQPVPDMDFCGSVEAGAQLLDRAVVAEFQKQVGEPLPPEMVPSVLDKVLAGQPIKYFGKEIRLSAEVTRAKRETASLIAQKVLSVWANRAGHVEMTLLAGGGALLFRDEFMGLLPCPVMSNDPVYANALGYLSSIRSKG